MLRVQRTPRAAPQVGHRMVSTTFTLSLASAARLAENSQCSRGCSSSGWKNAMRATVDCDWRHGIQRSSTADMEEESASDRRRNPTFLKIRCTVKLSRNISAETLLSFSSRAIWTVRRSTSIPRPCF